MENQHQYDVIIIGGSYAGLSAAMSLGRAIRKVLIIDSGEPCNRHTPHSHNFLTQDGQTPAAISHKAREQVLAYPTVQILQDTAKSASGINGKFVVFTDSGRSYQGRKLILATGVKDVLLPIKGFKECWGISVLHCPYCHGYEVKNETIAVIGNGDIGYEYAKLIHNWSSNLTLLCNGPSSLSLEQKEKLLERNIKIIETQIDSFTHASGVINAVNFKDGTSIHVKAVFSRSTTQQSNTIPAELGCEFHSEGYYNGLIKTDEFGKTSVPGIYAAGDNVTAMRSIASAVAAGTKAGAMVNHELIADLF